MICRSYRYWLAPLIVLATFAGAPAHLPQAAGLATAAPTAAVETPAAAPTYGPGSFNLQPTADLTDLSGYQATLKVGFKGNEGSQVSQWTETLTLLANGKPSARALTATFTGKAPAAAFVAPWSATKSGVYYRLGADGACAASVIEQQTDPDALPLILEPASFLPGAIGAEEAGAKKVNGVAAKDYKFNERALGVVGRATATGEVWVADPGGYVVKYSLTLKGGAEYFGEGGEGTLTWAYDVTKAGQPTAIVLPKDCPAGLVDAPLMDNAQNVQRYPGATLYTTSSTVTQVVDFYQKELPAAGWKLQGQPLVGQKAASLTFQQGASQLTVFISVGDKGVGVRLILGSSVE